MKALMIKFLTVMVLAGVVNSVVIEPAICFAHDDAVSQQQENEHGCSVCHPLHHEGLAQRQAQMNLIVPVSITSVESLFFALLDSPTRLIFHPPLAL